MRLAKPKRSKALGGLAALLALACGPAVQAQTLVRDAEIERTLRDYSNPIFAAAGLVPGDVEIKLVGDKSLNAFVTDGQKVFLHTGLIAKAETPNQLKGVIAHETGHIAGSHLARSDQAIRDAMVPAYVTVALGLLAMAAGAPDAGAALLASSQQFALLSFLRYSQVQESSADQAGVTFLEKSGQSGRGLLEFFENFRYMEVMSEARREPYFRSHPLSGDRIANLRDRVERQSNRDVKDSPEDVMRLKMAHAKIQGFLDTTARTFVKYPVADQSTPARYARAIALFRAPDLAAAVRETERLIAEQPDNPWFRELLGQIYYENGRIAESVAPNRKAVELAPEESLLRIGLARSLIATAKTEDLSEAETHLRAALRLEPGNAFAWNQLAVVADRRGQTGLARLATAEEAYALGDAARANRFAQTAMRNLQGGTPEWRRAADIRVVTNRDAARAAKRDPNGRARFEPVALSTRAAFEATLAAPPLPAPAHHHHAH